MCFKLEIHAQEAAWKEPTKHVFSVQRVRPLGLRGGFKPEDKRADGSMKTIRPMDLAELPRPAPPPLCCPFAQCSQKHADEAIRT